MAKTRKSPAAILSIAIISAGFLFLKCVYAAEPYYGKITDYSAEQVLISYSGVEKQEKFICSLKDFSCTLETEKTDLNPSEFSSATKSFFSADKSRAVIEQEIGDSTGIYATSLYKNEGGAMKFEKNIPLKNGIYRAIWSEDGKRILFFTRRSNFMLYDLTKGDFIAEMPFEEERYSRLTFSPKGNYLAYYVYATGQNNDRAFAVIDLIKGKTYKSGSKTEYWDLLSEGLTLFAFSPDEKQLIYLSDEKDNPTFFKVNLKKLSGKTLKEAKLFTKEYSVSDFVFWDNDTVFFSANRDNPLLWSLYSFNLKSETLDKISDNVSYADNMAKIGGYLAFLKSEFGKVSPVFYNPETKTLNRLSLAKEGDAEENGEPVKIGNLYGALLKPENPSKKLLIWLHGGPYRQTSLGFHPYLSYGVYDEVLYEAKNSGINVLKLDYSGSFGYGRKFAEKIRLNVGKADVADVVAAYNYAKKNLGVDEVYLIGNSYGGYLALKTIVENPEKFKGAFSINGVTDWRILTDRLGTSIFNVQFGGLFSGKNKKLYDQASIIPKIGKLKDQKIIIAYGTADTTIPSDQAGLLYENLIAKGKNAELVAFQGEGHVLTKKETLDDLCNRVLQFAGAERSGRCAF